MATSVQLWVNESDQGREWLEARELNAAIKFRRLTLQQQMQPVVDQLLLSIQGLSKDVENVLEPEDQKIWNSNRRGAKAMSKGCLSHMSVAEHRQLSQRLQDCEREMSYAALGHRDGAGTWIWPNAHTTGKALWAVDKRIDAMRRHLDQVFCRDNRVAARTWDYYDMPYAYL